MASEEEELDYSEKFKRAEEKKAQEIFAKAQEKKQRKENIQKYKDKDWKKS